MTCGDLCATVSFRLTVIGVVLGLLLLVWIIRWRRRRRAARELEEVLMPVEPTGDGKVLGERMSAAMATLKKTGGSTYLYDLPWYVIIGPPGAGKTTALVNSGIEFPLTQAQGNAEGLEGFGGTRYCDWWFAEDAVMIDTAGRYTTQDSNKTADEASWTAFLNLLKKSRPKQPINGVILAFSVEDMMTASPETLAEHAKTVRTRLAEVHETLKVDFPVYVLFTKSDLISGFREYFSSFSLSRRKAAWGVTFQTSDRKALTHELVPVEFDALVSRLSDEVVDRLNEEPDSIARIAIFGLPGQMALLRDNISDFMRRVFEPTRYNTNAILRGFYFTSGTQEGTPIDQVLGTMSRAGDVPSGFQPAFMSGKGKSFFLYDLLKNVIFEERDWVSHDKRAVQRSRIMRGTALTMIVLATVASIGAYGYSYWQNATLVKVASSEAGSYARLANDEIKREEINETELGPILPYLNAVRAMPAGYGSAEKEPVWEQLGLGQRDRLALAASDSYSDALEKMLRPRLMLSLEQDMPYIIQRGQTTEIYRALKVYLLLGGQGGVTDDATVKSYFDDKWRAEFEGRTGLDTRDQLALHLDGMLKLDDARDLLVDTFAETVTSARAAIVQLPAVDQAYALIMDGAAGSGLPDWSLSERTGSASDKVFASKSGRALDSMIVPAVFTYEGFWSYFYPQLEVVGERLREDQWVLDDAARQVEFEQQLDRLDSALQDRYRVDFKKAWDDVLDDLSLNSMSADNPRYDALGALASSAASPLLLLAREVDAETKITREFEGLEGLDPSQLNAEDVTGEVGNAVMGRVRSRSTGVQRILLDAMTGGNKNLGRVTGGTDTGNSISRPIERIEEEFARWHEILEGEQGRRPIDAVLGSLGAVWTNLRGASANPEQSAVMLPQLLSTLTQFNSQLPPVMAGLVNEAERDFRQGASDANVETMNRALNNRITFFCRENIISSYPFQGASRSLSIDNFSRFFGPGGDMQQFFTEYLEPYTERTSEGLRYRSDSEIAQRLSPATLEQFARAERIRQAFFANNANSPEVEITVAHVDSHSTIEDAILIINDMEIPTRRGDLPKTIVWPGQGKSTVLAISPTLDRPSVMQYRGSSWTFIQFLGAATSRTQRGDTLRATYTIGGRSITYDFTVNATKNPFTMPELSRFDCPQSLN